jgi:SWI/SNF-related matrix-associated actin-dependent regulator 1 of chromatin subfamily A
MDSGKVQKLVEILHEHAVNGDRTLLFSQFTSVLDILESVLETVNISFSRIDGAVSVAERQDLIDQYHQDESIQVFMLSTKAGGTGINLACANKVIIFDSSFNPHDDIQAENRAHRIGQKREVEIIRLITRGTIEDQIHALGNSKLILDERVSGEGESSSDAYKTGQKMIEDMLLEKRKDGKDVNIQDAFGENEGSRDLKDLFAKGLRDAGVEIFS